MISPEEMVGRIGERFGVHAGMRALHARGMICSGSFEPTAEAAALTRAAHMQGRVPVLARLSNGSGDPREPDRAPDVRGLAVSFELPDGSRTDIVAQTAPRFPVRTPEAFIELIEATKRERAALLRLPWFLLRNPSAIGALRENAAALRPPASYAEPTYYAIHAFRWSGPDGEGRWVRYTLEPRSDAGPEPDRSEHEYLSAELSTRLSEGTVRFGLDVQIAGPDDDPHDPTSVWTGEEQVSVGTLELDALAPGHDGIIFDPMRTTDGIEPSEDPILRYRPRAYAVSYDRRTDESHERPDWAR